MMAQVILVSAQVTTKSGVKVLSFVTFGAFSRVQSVTAGMIHGVRDVWGNYAGLRGVRAENETLRKQVADLEVRLQEQRALAEQSSRLMDMMNLKSSANLPLLAAQVIAGNPNPGMRTVTIDRGSADGVTADMAVIAPTGIVGRIVGRPSAHASIVQLLIDRNAGAGAVTERTRAGGMVVGSDKDPALEMELVSNLSDVREGDAVVASGVDGIYPKGFVIGHVASSTRGPGLYRVLTVRPKVDFSSLEYVLVVLSPARAATPETEAAPAGPAK
jgi:rod shape-determining protein MreC